MQPFQPRFSNFSVLVMAYAAVSITSKITSLLRYRMAANQPQVTIGLSATNQMKKQITAAISEVVIHAIDENFGKNSAPASAEASDDDLPPEDESDTDIPPEIEPPPGNSPSV